MQRIALAFLAAVLVTHLVGSVAATQVILVEVRRMGLPVPYRERLLTTLHDIVALAPLHLPALALALSAGFAAAAVPGHWLPRWRWLLFGLCGALAVLGLHAGARALLGFSPLAAAREDHGLALQAAAGWVGGYSFFTFLGLARR